MTALRARVGELEALLGAARPASRPEPQQLTAQQKGPRSLKWSAYGVVRPVVRPIAWRLRTFLIGPVRDEVAMLRAEVAALRARLDQIAAEATGPGLDRRMLAVMEQALLTIALDREDK